VLSRILDNTKTTKKERGSCDSEALRFKRKAFYKRPEEQSQTGGCQSSSVEGQPQCPGRRCSEQRRTSKGATNCAETEPEPSSRTGRRCSEQRRTSKGETKLVLLRSKRPLKTLCTKGFRPNYQTTQCNELCIVTPPRSLVRDGQTNPHRPRLVVSHSTCPPHSPREQLCNRSCSNKTHTQMRV
jgi:hypothetical protein